MHGYKVKHRVNPISRPVMDHLLPSPRRRAWEVFPEPLVQGIVSCCY